MQKPFRGGNRPMSEPAVRGRRAAVLRSVWLVVAALLAAAAPVLAAECVSIEDFAKAKLGEFPPDWTVRQEEGRGVYSVGEQLGVRFLRAVSRGLGIQAAKSHEWSLTTHPVLAWSWRLHAFPSGADERESKTNDSALAVYAVFPHSPMSVKSVKYIWSERVPRGTHLTSSRGLTQVRVARNGPERKGEWVEERVNVLADYRRFFEETGVPKPAGIAVLTDADDTKSVAQGDYANFRVCPP
ncbi:MAG: DUF3047 domain-containing protein [Candidatus Rokuibacteriota bacterium]